MHYEKVGDGPWRVVGIPLIDHRGIYSATCTESLSPALSRVMDFNFARRYDDLQRTGIAKVFGDDYWRELTQVKS